MRPNRYQELLETDLDAESFIRRALSQLESDF